MTRTSTFALVAAILAAAALAAGPFAARARADGDSPPPQAPKDPPAKPGDKPSDPAMGDPGMTDPGAKPGDTGMDGDKKADPKKPEPPAAPAFKLKDVDGKERTLDEFKDKWVVLEWTSASCPVVKKHYDTGSMQALQKKYEDKGVVWLSITSENPASKLYAPPDKMKKWAEAQKSLATAVLMDPDGAAGKAYGAKTTPDMRVIDPKGHIVYSGAIDDDPKMKDPTKANNYVAQVLDAGLAGKEPPVAATTPYG